MRRYETIIIIDPDLSDEGRAPVIDRVTELIPQFDGALFIVDEWGAKSLAYEIKKKTRGYYVRMDYCGNGALVSEIERFFRIDDRVLKFMTVLLDMNVDPEKILADLAEEKAAEAERLKAVAEPKAPVESETEAKAPVEPETEAKAPVESETEAKAPVESETEAKAPVEAKATDTPEPEETEETKATDSSEEA